MTYDQSSTLKHALCSSPSPLSKGGGEVLERICSKLGGGLDKAIVPVDSSVVPIDGPYTHRAGELQDMVLRNIDCANLSAEYSLIDSHFSIIDDLKIVNNQETDLYFYHSDHLGSSSFITDADGIVSQHLQYLPYGELFVEQRDAANYYTPYKFSAKEKDEETGYSYFGARYYMSDVSVWLSVDPMTDKYPYQTLYSYCGGRPTNVIDPNGTNEVSPDEYGVNDKGEVTFLKAKEGPDELYKVDNNGNKVDVDNNGKMEEGTDYATFDKKDINVLGKPECMYLDGDGSFRSEGYGTIIETTNKKTADKLFEFFANNTSVEAANLEFSKNGKTSNILMTNLSDWNVQNTEKYINSKASNGWSLIRHSHNHPGGSTNPSNYVINGERYGDAISKNNLLIKHPYAKFYIYTKNSKRYYEY